MTELSNLETVELPESPELEPHPLKPKTVIADRAKLIFVATICYDVTVFVVLSFAAGVSLLVKLFNEKYFMVIKSFS